jgi:hypothetical protein
MTLLGDYAEGERGHMPMTTRKCRLWHRAYRNFKRWKQERDLDRLEPP